MLSLARTAARRINRVPARSFAEIVSVEQNTPSTSSNNDVSTNGHSNPFQRIPVREDHGLYAFFRRKSGDDLVGDAKYETFESPDSGQVMTGRAWKASELRLKSFKDLHTLWYVSLREKNLLATQKEEVRRLGVTYEPMQVSQDKVHSCLKTMGRIKAVINERRRAYLEALKLFEEEKDKQDDRVLLELQNTELEEAAEKYRAKKVEIRHRRRLLRKTAVQEEVKQEEEVKA